MSIEVRKNSQIFQDSNNTYYPEDETQISSIVKELFKKNQPTELIGLGSKSFIGNKIQSAKKLSLSKLSGIIEYLPEELYIKVKANTPLELIEKELEKNNQELLLSLLILDLLKMENQIKEQLQGVYLAILLDHEDLKLEV